MKDLQLCIQWILFARRPLKRQELYFAVWSGLSNEDLANCTTAQISIKAMDRFVVGSSKGLTEVIKSVIPTVQSIHESVRDFLVKDDGLRELWLEIDDESETSVY